MRHDDEEEISRVMSPVGESATADGGPVGGDADRLASCTHCTHWRDDHDGIVAVPWSGGYMRCANCMVCEEILSSEDTMLSMM